MLIPLLKQHRDLPITFAQLKKNLPREVMHETLKTIIEYLFSSGKIIFGPRGIQWIFSQPDHIKKMKKGTLEL